MRARALPLLLVIAVGVGFWAVREGTQASPGESYVMIPGRTWVKEGGRLAKTLGVSADSVYVVDRGARRAIRLPARFHAMDATMGAKGIVAVLGTRPPSTLDGTIGVPKVAVVDAGGQTLTELDFGLAPSWSPNGLKVALLFGTRKAEGIPQIDSVGVWDSETRSLMTFDDKPIGVGWLDDSTLLLDHETRINEVRLPSTSQAPTPYMGLDVSPDRRFAVSFRWEAGVQLWDNQGRREITREIKSILGGSSSFVSHVPPFWVTDSDHILGVPTCNYSLDGPGATCEIVFVDAEERTIVSRRPGEAVALSGDGTMLILREQGHLTPLRVTERGLR